MFCPKCGTQIDADCAYCKNCGTNISNAQHSSANIPSDNPIVMLNPDEVVPVKEEKDSSKTFRGTGKAFGVALMLVSVLLDMIAMFTVGSDFFIPLLIFGTVLFVIGLFMTILGR